MTPLLETVSLSVHAGTKRLLGEVNLSFERGQTVALVGPNGAGKSTLLRALSGELRPQSGHVRLRGRDLTSYAPQLLATHRAILSQRTNIAFPFTVADVVRMGVNRQRGLDVEALVETTLAEFDMTDLTDRVITTLSGGEQQRAHFARVLVQLAWGQENGGSGVLLLDEPTAGLDLRHQLGMIDALKRRASRGVLIIAIVHDLNLAALLAERVIVLDYGRVDCDGFPAETITDGMLERVFSIETTVSQLPPYKTPFLLPQVMTVAKHFGART